MKVCKGCGGEKERGEFYTRPNTKDGLWGKCKVCVLAETTAYSKTPAGKRAGRQTQLKLKYGIRLEDMEQIWSEQGAKCAICHRTEWPERRGERVVDHDHRTGQVRGVLCHPCNMVLGLIRDDPGALVRAAQYLERE